MEKFEQLKSGLDEELDEEVVVKNIEMRNLIKRKLMSEDRKLSALERGDAPHIKKEDVEEEKLKIQKNISKLLTINEKYE